MDKQLANYVRSTLHQGFTLEQVAERLHKEGWHEDDIQRALTEATQHHRSKARLIIALTGFIAFLALGILAYLFIISPAFVEKPQLDKPLVSKSVAPGVALIDSSHIEYVLNELGAYKLHQNPLSGDLPEIEIVLTDTRQAFTAIVENNVVRVRPGAAASPDARITASQDAVVMLATAEGEAQFNPRAAQLLREREQRGYAGELLTDERDLLLKGYLALYREKQGVIESSGITGSVIAELPLAGFVLIGTYVLVLILWFSALLVMAFGHR